MKYLDANIFIYAALEKEAKGEHARDILTKILLGESAMTSSLSVDELVWSIWKNTRDRDEAIKHGLMLFEMASLRISPVTRDDAYRSLSLMKKHPHLKPRDAIHLSVALRLGADCIVSDDKDFDGIMGLKREGLD